MNENEALLKELGAVSDSYKVDVRQFLDFMKDRKLHPAASLKEFADWLEADHDGKRYSPATVNRKIAAAKSRIRFEFRHGPSAESLGKEYSLPEVLAAVKPRRLDPFAVPAEKALDIDEVKTLCRESKDGTIKLMVSFLVGTGVRVSEMLAIRIADLSPAEHGYVRIRIVGKARKERFIHAKLKAIDRIKEHFQGIEFLFEHHGKPFSRISVTNRIKIESLKTIRREVTPGQLRHTWAHIQIRHGRNVRAVAAALGRSGAGTAAKIRDDKTLEPHEAFLDILEPNPN